MGGTGSGRRWRWDKKDTVEDCRILDVNWMIREGIFDDNGCNRGNITWSGHFSGKTQARIGYEVNLPQRWLRLQYSNSRTEKNYDYRIKLTTTALPWGSERWWFICGLTCNGQDCNRRVGKLYLPPGGNYFGCRHCYNLTYTSCQESHQYDRLLLRTDARVAGYIRTVEDDWKYELRMEQDMQRRDQRRRRRELQGIANAALPGGR